MGFGLIERTFDTDLVRDILSNPELKKRAGSFVEIADFDPANQPEIYYLVVKNEENKEIGLLICHILDNPAMYQGHVNYLPDFWGENLALHTKEGCKWMFNNTECLKIVSFAPDVYPEVKKHALKCGFIEEGYLKNSAMYDEKLVNQSIVGLCK